LLEENLSTRKKSQTCRKSLTNFITYCCIEYISPWGAPGIANTFTESNRGTSRCVWSYNSWIYNYLCNHCLSPLTLWVRILLRWGVLDTTLCDKVSQWLGTGLWFSPETPVSSKESLNSNGQQYSTNINKENNHLPPNVYIQ
jgi:hypothetical protein